MASLSQTNLKNKVSEPPERDTAIDMYIVMDSNAFEDFDRLIDSLPSKRAHSPEDPGGHTKRIRSSNDEPTDTATSMSDSRIPPEIPYDSARNSMRPEVWENHGEGQYSLGADIRGPTSLLANSHTTSSQDPSATSVVVNTSQVEDKKATNLTWTHLGMLSMPCFRSKKAQDRDWALIDYVEKPNGNPSGLGPPWKCYDKTALVLEPTAPPLDIILMQPDVLYAGRLSRVPAFSVLPHGHEIVMTYLVSFEDAARKLQEPNMTSLTSFSTT